jgi:hypothetical protein
MSVTLSLLAPEPGSPGFPVASRDGVLVANLVRALREVEPPLDVALPWLQPPQARGAGELGEWLVTTRWSAGELRRMLKDRSRCLLFVYPIVPVFSYSTDPAMLLRVLRAFQALWAKSRLSRQRIVVLVSELPAERAEGQAIADGRVTELHVQRVREIERALFRAAHRIIAPIGLAESIVSRYELDPSRLRTFRRHDYRKADALAQPPPLEYESGTVNFFYSGAVDAQVAANFREILRSIRNAPNTRLHVCGPGRDSAREWLAELDVPNVRHHGQLGAAEHDWLAERCDIGLVLYPADNPYNHLRPTLKYSAYLANGLAVLGTDLRGLADNIRQDRVGVSLPIRELALELLRWAARPKLWAEAKARSAQLAPEVSSGAETRSWFQDVAELR